MYKKVIILIIMLFFFLQNISAQETDSLKSYELEPAYITTNKGGIDYTTLNYFSKKNSLFRFGGVYPIGIYGDSTINFGVKIETKKNNNNLIIQEAVFLIHLTDTINIKFAKFYVLLKDSSGEIKKNDLNHQNLSFIEHPFYNPKSEYFNNNRVYLTQVKFNSTVISFGKNDELYFMKEDTPPFVTFYTSMMFVTSKKVKSYYYKNEKIYRVNLQSVTSDLSSKHNAVWQVRLKYCEYSKE